MNKIQENYYTAKIKYFQSSSAALKKGCIELAKKIIMLKNMEDEKKLTFLIPDSSRYIATQNKIKNRTSKVLQVLPMVGCLQPAIHPRNKRLALDNGLFYAVWEKQAGFERKKLADGVFDYVIKVIKPNLIYIRRNVNFGTVSTRTSKGNIRKDWNWDRGHSSIANGEDVLYAGRIFIREGELLKWDSMSGHYKPGNKMPPTDECQVEFARNQTSMVLTKDGERILDINKFKYKEFSLVNVLFMQ